MTSTVEAMASSAPLASPPSPTSVSATAAGAVIATPVPSRSPSSMNLKGRDETARNSIAAFASQQAPLLAAMFAQRFIHVSNQTGADVDGLHSHFLTEFLPTFLEYLHTHMGSSLSATGDGKCETCSELGQRATFVAACNSLATPNDGSFQRSNSVSFGTHGKNSPPPLVNDNSPCSIASSSLLASTANTTSVYSLNVSPFGGLSSSHNSSTAVGSKLKNLIGHFVGSRRRRAASTNTRDGNGMHSSSDSSELASPALSLPVEMMIEGFLEIHSDAAKSIGSSHTTISSRGGLSTSRDFITNISHHEQDREDDAAASNTFEVTKSTEFLSPWLLCHFRLLRSCAGPILVIRYPPDTNKPPCGFAMSVVSEVRAATIGDALTNDDHAFILISSSLSSRVLLRAASRSDMNQWLDALRPFVNFVPSAMSPLFPHNKFGLTVTGGNLGSSNNNNLLTARYGGYFGQRPVTDFSKNSPSNLSVVQNSASRSVSAVARRRIHTSPAVDFISHKNKIQNKTIETDGASSESTTHYRSGSHDLSSYVPPTASQSPTETKCQQPNNSSSSSSAQTNRSLNAYPWYWGSISRNDAAKLVCKFGESGNGCFLIRQSESRLGDYVITFNCDGKAKHLRLTVYPDGRCQMNQYAFQSVQSLVDHFRTNALPIELNNNDHNSSTSSMSDVMLTNYVTRRSTTPLQSTVRE